ncbi:MAG TPA: DUF4835 family protein [Chitinophagaceae bacterium]|jgi:hypothetical protein|nr:DUF4835 family protein [Chitinophagaceae bacterium]
MKNVILILIFTVAVQNGQAQELQARITINANKVSNKVDKKVFQTLQTALTNFLNNRKWTKDNFQPNEKIRCNFMLTIDQEFGDNIYKGSLTVQAARPVYNAAYESPLINFADNDVSFRYVEFQPIEFNENRVQGNDPVAANLPALLAYYVNLIIGLDYDSFSPRGGDPYFQKAQNIVNNAPEGSSISGWKTFDGIRNRFRLVENLMDNRFTLVHDAIYSYYRKGLDQFFESEINGRQGVLSALTYLTNLNQEFPNSMVMQFFFQGKSAELVKIFSRAPNDMKAQAREMLVKLDLTNAAAYKELR